MWWEQEWGVKGWMGCPKATSCLELWTGLQCYHLCLCIFQFWIKNQGWVHGSTTGYQQGVMSGLRLLSGTLRHTSWAYIFSHLHTADIALEWVTTVHKRPQTCHIIFIPHLMSASWQKSLGKLCNMIFTIPLGTDMWPLGYHELLAVGFCLPLSCHRPWHLKDTPFMDWVVRALLSSLPTTSLNWGGDILHIFFCQARSPDSLPSRVAQKMLLHMGWGNSRLPSLRMKRVNLWFRMQTKRSNSRRLGAIKEARGGDILVTPFQCDFCHLINIMGWEALDNLASDVRLLKCIGWVHLDAFWSREPGTVKGILDETKRIASSLGFAHTLFRPRGPFPPIEGVAVVMIQRLLHQGCYWKTV